ncbi:MAG TPA: E2/UBC family protein [Mucilaginibacter sp.]|jgi:hypothetical protein
MRKDFSLTEEDLDFLIALNLQWESVRCGTGDWVIIHDYPIPEGYNVRQTQAALKIDAGYPVSQIDMVYFYPSLGLISGKPIGALTPANIDGKIWQRWSRHRTGENPWRPGLDNIGTHIQLVNFWLERELLK